MIITKSSRRRGASASLRSLGWGPLGEIFAPRLRRDPPRGRQRSLLELAAVVEDHRGCDGQDPEPHGCVPLPVLGVSEPSTRGGPNLRGVESRWRAHLSRAFASALLSAAVPVSSAASSLVCSARLVCDPRRTWWRSGSGAGDSGCARRVRSRGVGATRGVRTEAVGFPPRRLERAGRRSRERRGGGERRARVWVRGGWDARD